MFDRVLHYARLLGPMAVAASVWGKLSGRPVVMSFRRDGVAHPIFMRFPSSDADGYVQIFRDGEYEFDVAKRPDVIVDAGANVGLASIYFANKFPHARIFAIECERSNYEILELNAKAYPNIVPIHAALWKHDGKVDIVDPGLGQWGFMTAASSGAGTSASVRASTLDSIMREHGISHIDVLKMDIEGAELEVLDSSAGWIDKVDTIIAELHDRLKAGCEQSFARATASFSERWRQGENFYVSRQGTSAANKA